MTSSFIPTVDRTVWRAELAELLARLAAGFVHRPPSEVDAALTDALAAVGSFLGADRAHIYRTASDRQQLVMTQEWCATGVVPVDRDRRTVPMDQARWLVTVCRNGTEVELGDLADLPAEADAERHLLAADGVRAAILLPLLAQGRLMGVARFDAVDRAAAWPPDTGASLRPFADACASAIAAQRAIGGLEASELRHRSVLDEVGDVIVRIGPDGALSYVNRAWYELTGNPVADTVGADPLENVHPDDRVLALEHMAAAMAGQPGVREVRFLAHDGGVRWMEVKGRAVFDADGNLAGFSGVLHDVTERKEAESRVQSAREEAERARDEAEQARDLAERASRAKSEFLSRMSHELRTPLNAILGFSQLLEFAELQGEDADNLAMINRAGRHLLDLINDALDVSRIESGRLSMSLEPVDLTDVAAESVDLVRNAASARGVTVRVVGDRDGAHVQADRQRLKQVLVNLLTNAVKYNRAGGDVRVGWAPVPGESPAGCLRIEVTDTGIGIPPTRLDDVFLPFERIGAEATDVEGSGIGLALTKSLVDAMGGRIGVSSTLGAGSTFYVDFPLAGPVAAAGDPPSVPPADGGPDGGITHTVLYVEDNPSNLMLMRRILARRPRVRVLEANDVPTGLDMAREHRPDLVLLDLHLPGGDGSQVLAAIRADADPQLSTTPVVIVTADLTPGTERRLMQTGATAFLPKPVDIAVLLEIVDRHLLPI